MLYEGQLEVNATIQNYEKKVFSEEEQHKNKMTRFY
jgi:hypothetical protein